MFLRFISLDKKCEDARGFHIFYLNPENIKGKLRKASFERLVSISLSLWGDE